MIDFFTSCLDLIFMWFGSDSWLVILPFGVMVFSLLVMLVFRLVGAYKC